MYIADYFELAKLHEINAISIFWINSIVHLSSNLKRQHIIVLDTTLIFDTAKWMFEPYLPRK